MSSRKEEERNEKIIRGLLKLPPNRRCINCNSLGPQYVCTNFWTFICIACSGIHREFTHRVKSVSMAKFTTQEVEALQRGGNQRAREQFLKDWDTERLRLPANSNPDKIREFIKSVYVDKKYAGGRSSDKPPRDTQSLKGHEEDHRRASSYHSFSQSPPYDHQYEERRYGKQAGMLTRKPGSDRGHYYEGKVSSFMYSTGHQGEQMYEDRFANEGSNPRMPDFLVSSTGDPTRSGVQSPSTNDPRYSSPPQVKDIFVEDTLPKKMNTSSESLVKGDTDKIPHPHRTASSGSFGSFDSNSTSFKSGNSGSLTDAVLDAVLEPEHTAGVQQTGPSTFPSLPKISSAHATNQDLFGPSFLEPPTSNFASSIDLFSDSSQLPSLTNPTEQKPQVTPSENEGWATFDFPPQVRDIFVEDTLPTKLNTSSGSLVKGDTDKIPHPHRTASSGSFGSFDSNSLSFKSGNSGSLTDAVLEPEHTAGVQQTGPSTFPSLLQISSAHATNQDLFGPSFLEPPTSNFASSIDLFSDSSQLPSLTNPSEQKQVTPSSENEGWATFDFPHHVGPSFEASKRLPSLMPPSEGTITGKLDVFSSIHNNSGWFSVQSSTDHGQSFLMGDQWHVGSNEVKDFVESRNAQGGTNIERKSMNPFDLPNDLNPEVNSLFMDVSSLQEGLPDKQPPDMFLAGLPDPWFLVPSVPQGGLAHFGGQVPSSQLPNILTNDPVAPLGGNPFA